MLSCVVMNHLSPFGSMSYAEFCCQEKDEDRNLLRKPLDIISIPVYNCFYGGDTDERFEGKTFETALNLNVE